MSEPKHYPIRGGGYRAEVSDVGAALVLLAHDETGGGYRLAGDPAGHRDPLPFSGAVVAPWPGGVRDGFFIFDGIEHQLAVNDPHSGAALNGFTWWQQWKVVSHNESRIEQGIEVGLHKGWPYQLRLTVAYELGPDGLTVTQTATNIGGYHAPFGLGSHLYLRAGEAGLDDCVLTLAAGTRLPLDPHRGLPNAYSQPAAGTDYDFTAPRPLGGVRFEAAFGALDADLDGCARHRLRGPDGRGVELWTGPAFGWLHAAVLEPGDGGARALALVPATCPPDAFNLGIDLVVLQPGETWRGRWGLTRLGSPD